MLNVITPLFTLCAAILLHFKYVGHVAGYSRRPLHARIHLPCSTVKGFHVFKSRQASPFDDLTRL